MMFQNLWFSHSSHFLSGCYFTVNPAEHNLALESSWMNDVRGFLRAVEELERYCRGYGAVSMKYVCEHVLFDV